MKKFFLFAIILISGLSAYSQVATDSVKAAKAAKEAAAKAEEARIAEQKKARRDALDKKFEKYSKDRFVIDFNGTNWIYNKNDARFGSNFQTKWYSRGVNIYFTWDFRFKGSRVSVAPGIGYANTNIYERSAMLRDSSGTHFQQLNYGSDTSVKVNKIAFQYVEIPIELRIRTNPDKLNNMWKFAIGIKAGIRVDTHTKEKLKEGSVTKVYVERRFSDFNLFRFGPTLRVGYSFFNITAYYGVLNMFKAGLGPTAHEFALGISFQGL